MLVDLLKDLLYPKAIVLGNVEDFDVVAFDAVEQVSSRKRTYWRFFPCIMSLRK